MILPYPCPMMREPGMIARLHATRADAHDIVAWVDGQVFTCIWVGELPELPTLCAMIRSLPHKFTLLGSFSL